MKKIRVLLADDHPIVRTGIRGLLEEAEDIEVVGEAGDGEAALRLNEQLTPDVLVLDMSMPGLSGVDVIRRLNENAAPVKVLALSAYDSIQYISGSLESGAYGYLAKEESPEIIVEAVRGVASGKKDWMSKSVLGKVKRMRENDLSNNSNPIQKLSRREREVLKLVAQGNSNPAISEKLFISIGTVKNHVTNIYSKLGLASRAEAVSWAWEHRLVE